jgi:hypothetical protein
MHSPETYPWQTPYMSAILETDEDQMRTRPYEAIAAIEQRRQAQYMTKKRLRCRMLKPAFKCLYRKRRRSMFEGPVGGLALQEILTPP